MSVLNKKRTIQEYGGAADGVKRQKHHAKTPERLIPEAKRKEITRRAGVVFVEKLPKLAMEIDAFLERNHQAFERPQPMGPEGKIHEDMLCLYRHVRDFGMRTKKLLLCAEAFVGLAYPAFSYGEDEQGTIVKNLCGHVNAVYELAGEANVILCKNLENIHHVYHNCKGSGKAAKIALAKAAEVLEELNVVNSSEARSTLLLLCNGIRELLNFAERNAARLNKLGLKCLPEKLSFE